MPFFSEMSWCTGEFLFFVVLYCVRLVVLYSGLSPVAGFVHRSTLFISLSQKGADCIAIGQPISTTACSMESFMAFACTRLRVSVV